MTPLAEVKASIEQQVGQEKNEAMTKWVADLKEDDEDKVPYAPGFTPPPATTGTLSVTTP